MDMTEQLHFPFSLSCIGEGNGNPLQCSCLENPMDGGAWWTAVSGVAQSRTRLKRLGGSSSILSFTSMLPTRADVPFCTSVKNVFFSCGCAGFTQPKRILPQSRGLKPEIGFPGLKSRCRRDPDSWEAGGGLCASPLPASGVASFPRLVAASLQPLPACPQSLLLFLCPSSKDTCDSLYSPPG